MLPLSPLFLPSTVHSPLGGNCFDPNTLILRLPAITSLKAGMQRIGLDVPPAEAEITADIEAAFRHEFQHWLQFSGTSIGAFLSLCHFTQSQTAVNYLLADKSALSFVEERVLKGTPVVPIRDLCLLDTTSVQERCGRLGPFPQIWYDHLLVYQLFFSAERQYGIGWPIGKVSGEVIADCLLYASDHYEICDYAGNEIARALYSFADEDRITLHAFDRRPLTTRTLFEAQAAIAELTMVADWMERGYLRGPDRVNAVLERIFTTDYGLPIEVFLGKLRADAESMPELVRLLQTAAVCIDIALNPRLPPIHVLNDKPWRWCDIYPPHRFITAVESVLTLGLLPNFDPGTIRQYRESLASGAQIPMCTSGPHPYRSSRLYQDFQSLAVKIQSGAIPPGSTPRVEYHEYLLWVQSQLWDLRAKDVTPFINLSLWALGAESRPEGPHLPNTTEDLWFRPPIKATYRSLAHTHHYSKFASIMVTSACIHHLLFDLVIGSNACDMSAYPTEDRQSIFERALTECQRQYPCEVLGSWDYFGDGLPNP